MVIKKKLQRALSREKITLVINKHFWLLKFIFKIGHKAFKNHQNKRKAQNTQKMNKIKSKISNLNKASFHDLVKELQKW